MNSELQAILNYMEKERGIDREVLIQAVEFALQTAARKGASASPELRIEIDRQSLDIRAFAPMEVVDSVRPGKDQVSLKKARAVKPDAAVGEMVEVEATPHDFGRIAAQTAKQAILQKIRQAEREGCRVRLADSTTAGNCAVGSAGWCRAHNLDPAGHVAPTALAALATGFDGRRVRLVLAAALRRHATDMRRGYCTLG